MIQKNNQRWCWFWFRKLVLFVIRDALVRIRNIVQINLKLICSDTIKCDWIECFVKVIYCVHWMLLALYFFLIIGCLSYFPKHGVSKLILPDLRKFNLCSLCKLSLRGLCKSSRVKLPYVNLLKLRLHILTCFIFMSIIKRCRKLKINMM